MIPNTARNKKIVLLRDTDPDKWSIGKLAEEFGLTRPTIFEIYHREKAKENKNHKLPRSLQKKYSC